MGSDNYQSPFCSNKNDRRFPCKAKSLKRQRIHPPKPRVLHKNRPLLTINSFPNLQPSLPFFNLPLIPYSTENNPNSRQSNTQTPPIPYQTN